MKPVILLATLAGCFIPIHMRFVNPDSQHCASQCIPNEKFKYRSGTSYEFQYNGETSTGIQGAATRFSRMRISAVAVIEVHNSCNFVLRIKNVQLMSNDPQYPTRLNYAPGTTEFRNALERLPLKFEFQDGRIDNLCADPDETVWTLNVKRGCLSAFQNSMESLNTGHTVRETDITGECDAEYEVVKKGWYTTQVKKSKDLLKCSKRHGYNTAIHGIRPNSPENEVQSLPLVNSTHTCNQEIHTHNGYLKYSKCEETHLFRPFAKDQSGAVTQTSQTLRFLRQYPQINRFPYGKHERVSLYFQHVNSAGENTATRMREAMSILQNICEMPRDDVRPETPEMFATLVHTLRDLDTTALKSIYHHINGRSICENNPERSLKFFMDAIPMIGSSASVSLMADMISKRQVKGYKADMWVTSLTFIAEPKEEMFAALEPILRTQRTSSPILLALSSLINNFCRKNPGTCDNNRYISQLIDLYTHNLGPKCNNYFSNKEEVLVTLRALGNAGNALRAVPTINDCLANEKLPTEVRVAATVSFRHMACQADKSTLMSVFRDDREDSELRIMSYLAIMECPSNYDIRQIKETLNSETINQVGSFVWSHLTNILETSNPHKQQIRNILESEDLKKSFDFDRRKYSRNYDASFFLDRINTGASVEGNVIFSSQSFVPRAAMANLTVDLFGHSLNLFEIGGRAEGLDALLDNVFGPRNIFKREAQSTGSPKKMSHKLRRINQNYKRKQELTASGYIRMFGNEMAYMNLNSDHNLDDFINSLLRKDKDVIHFSQNIMLLDSTMIIPTSIGLPLNITVNATASVDFRASADKTIKPFQLSLLLQPSGAIQFATQMSVDAFVTRVGMKMVSTLHTSTKTCSKLSFDKGFKFELDTPKDKMEIIDFSTQFYTIHHKSAILTSITTEPRREYKWCTGDGMSRMTGLEFCASMSLPGISIRPDAPYFPLTGPVTMDLSLHNRDRLSSYVFFTDLDLTRNEFTYITKFDTPGSITNRRIDISLLLKKPTKAIDFKMITPWKAVTASGIIVNDPQLKRYKFDILIDQSQRYSINAELQIDRNRGTISYMPNLEVNIHGQPAWSVKGNFHKTKTSRLAMDMQTDFYADKPMAVKAVYENTNSVKSISGHVQLDSNKIYSIDSKVEHSLKSRHNKVKPTLSIKTPEGEIVNLDSSLIHIPSRSLDIKLSLDKVFRRPFEIETLLRVASGKHRSRYMMSGKVSSHFLSTQITGNIDRRPTKRMSSSRLRITYYIPKVGKDTVTFNGKFRDRGTKANARHRLIMSVDMLKNAHNNFKLDHNFNWRSKNLETDVDFHYGSNFKDLRKRIFLSKKVTYVNTKRLLSMSYHMAAKYLAMDLNAQLKGSHKQTTNTLSTNSMLRLSPRKTYTSSLRLDKSKRNIYTGFYSVIVPTRAVTLESTLTRMNDRHYTNNLDFSWERNKKANLFTTVKMPSDTRYDMQSTIHITKRPSVTIDSSVNVDPKDMRFSVDTKKGNDKYAVLLVSKCPYKQYEGRLELVHPERKVEGSVTADWSKKYTSNAEFKWNAIRDETARVSASVDVDVRRYENMQAAFDVKYKQEAIAVNMNHRKGNKYVSHIDVTYSPNKVITLDTTFDRRRSWYETVTSANFKLTSPCRYIRKFSFNTVAKSQRKMYTNHMTIELSDMDLVSIHVHLRKPYSLRDLSTNISLASRGWSIQSYITHKLTDALRCHFRTEMNSRRHHHVDLHINADNKGNYRKNDLSADMLFKSTIPRYEKIELAVSHSNDRQQIKQKLTADLAPLGDYEYSFSTNTYSFRKRKANNGRLFIKVPFFRFRTISSKWNHLLTPRKIESMTEGMVGSDRSLYDFKAEYKPSRHRTAIASNFKINTPSRYLRQFKVDMRHTLDKYHNTISSKIDTLYNRYKRTAYDFNIRKNGMNLGTDLEVLTPWSHPVNAKVSVKLNDPSKKANAQFSWSRNQNVTVDGTLTAHWPHFIDGNMLVTTPLEKAKKLTWIVRHGKTRDEWVSSSSFVAPFTRFNVDSTMRFDLQPKIDLKLRTPYNSVEVGFLHTGDWKTSANTRASFGLYPKLGQLVATSSLENGPESKATLRIDTPFREYEYAQTTVKYSSGRMKNVNIKVEYKPKHVITIETEHKMSDLRDVHGLITVTTPFWRMPYISASLRHHGDYRRFNSKLSYEFPRYKSTDIKVSYDNSQYLKTEGYVELKTPHENYKHAKASFESTGHRSYFHGQSKITLEHEAIFDSSVKLSYPDERTPKIEASLNYGPCPFKMFDDKISLTMTHTGLFDNFNTEVTGNYGRWETFKKTITFSLTDTTVNGLASLNVQSRRVPFNIASVSFSHKGLEKDYYTNFRAKVDDKKLDMVSLLDYKDDVIASFTLETPYSKFRDMELGLTHKAVNSQYLTQFDTKAVTKIPYVTKNEKITTDIHYKYTPDRKMEASIDIETPQPNYRKFTVGTEMRARQYFTSMSMKTYGQYMFKRIEYEGTLSMEDGIRTTSSIVTPFKNHKEMTMAFNMGSKFNNFDGHIKYKNERRIDFSGKLEDDNFKVTIQTPYKNYQNLGAEGQITYRPDAIILSGNIQYSNFDKIAPTITLEYPYGLKINIVTPFPKYKEISAAYKFDGDKEIFVVTSHVQYMTGKRLSLRLDFNCNENVKINIQTPFRKYEMMAAEVSYSGPFDNLQSNGFVEFTRGKRIDYSATMKYPHVFAINMQTPFRKYESLSLSLNKESCKDMKFCSVSAHLQYANNKRIDFTAKGYHAKEYEITLKTPFRKLTDIAVKGHYNRVDDVITSGGHFKYDRNKMITLNADLTVPNKFEVKLQSPFRGYETLSASGNLKGNRQVFTGDGHMEYTTGNRLVATVNADMTKGIRGTINVKSPFVGYEEVEVDADIDGTPKKFSGKAHISYAPYKKIEVEGDLDLVRKTEGKIKIKTPFRNYEEISASGDVDGRLEKFKIEGDLEYGYGKKIEVRTKVNTRKNYDVSASLKSPFKYMEDLSMKLGLRGNCKNYGITANLQYAQDKQLSFEHKLNLKSTPAVIFASVNTPFKNFESNHMTLTVTGKKLSDFRINSEFESSYLRRMTMALSHYYYNIHELRSSLDFTSFVPKFEDIKLSLSNSKASKDIYIHRSSIQWDKFKAVDVNINTNIHEGWYGKRDITNSISISTPFDKMRTVSTKVEYSSSKSKYSGNIESTVNNKKIVDTSVEYDDKLLSVSMKAPHPARLTINGDISKKAITGDAYINWNEEEYDSNVRVKADCKDTSSYYAMKKSCNIDITNPKHRINIKSQHDSSSYYFKSMTSVTYNDKQMFYDITRNDRRTRYSSQVTRDASIKIGYPMRTVELSGSHEMSSTNVKNEMTFAWDVNRQSDKKVVVSSDITKKPRYFEHTLKLSLPSINKEIGMNTKLAYKQGRTLVDGHLRLMYNRDEGNFLNLKCHVYDSALRHGDSNYTVTMTVQHPASLTDIRLLGNLANTDYKLASDMSASIRFNRTVVKSGMKAELDKLSKSFNIKMTVPFNNMQTKVYMVRENGYEWHLVNSFIDQGLEYHTKLLVDPNNKKIVLEMNNDYNNPNNMLNLHIGYTDPRHLSIKLSRKQFDVYREVDDASMAVTLNTSRLIHTRIHWRPELLRELQDMADARVNQVGQSLRGQAMWIRTFIYDLTVFTTAEILKVARQDLEPIIKYGEMEVNTILRDLDDIQESITEMVERNDFNIRSIKTAIRDIKKSVKDLTKFSSKFAMSFIEDSAKLTNEIINKLLVKLSQYERCIPQIINPLRRAIRSNLREIISSLEVYQEYLNKVIETIRSPAHSLRRSMKSFVERNSNRLVDKMADVYTSTMYNVKDKINGRLEALTGLPHYGYMSEFGISAYKKGMTALRYMNVRDRLQRLITTRYNRISLSVANQLENIKATLLNMDQSHMIIYRPEIGEIQFEIYLPFQMQSLQEIPTVDLNRYVRNVRSVIRKYTPKYWSVWDIYYMYKPVSWNPMTWIPPYSAHAIQAGKQHFITFDGVHYDFAGGCSYLLTRDFVDASFTVIMNMATDRSDIRKKSLMVYINTRQVEIFTDYRVEVDNRPAELPMKVNNAWVRRVAGRIVITSPLGFTVDADIEHDMYTVSVSGWYFGKVGGLLGTYNNEQSDDFITPRREVIKDITRFANSWEVGRSCGYTRNYAVSVKSEPTQEGYKACNDIFTSMWSPLRSCFKLINTTPFIEKCLEDYKFIRSDDTANVCNSSRVYIQSCSQAGIPLAFPSQCVMCKDFEGKTFGQNEWRTLRSEDGTTPKSADVIFVLEEKKCLEYPARLAPVTQYIDRQFQYKRFRDVRYGLVAFGGHDTVAHSHTLDGLLTNTASVFINRMRKLKVFSKPQATDVLSAVSLAASYPFRTGVSKVIVLVTCDSCEKSKLEHADVIKRLQQQHISVILIKQKQFEDSESNAIPIRASNIKPPTDKCTELAKSTNGEAYDMNSIMSGHRLVRNAHMKTIAKKVVTVSDPIPCQNCQCVVGHEGIHHAMCTPCSNSSASRLYNYLTTWNKDKSSPSVVYINNNNKM